MKYQSILFTILFAAAAAEAFGGENRIQGDAGAEANLDAFSNGLHTARMVPAFRDSSTAWEGRYSVRYEYRKQTAPDRMSSSAIWFLKTIGFAATPELMEGEEYTFSFYAKAAQEGYQVKVIAAPGRHSWNELKDSRFDKTLPLTKEWMRYSLTFRPKFWENYKDKIYALNLSFPNGNGTVWVDALQLEKGSVPTPFKPVTSAAVGVVAENSPPCNIWLEDESIKLKVNVHSYEKLSSPKLILKLIDWRGRMVKTFEDTIPCSGTNDYDLTNLPLGWFKATGEIISGADTVASHSFAFVKIRKPITLLKEAKPYTGGIGPYYDSWSDEVYRKLGVKRYQINIEWKEVEAAPGTWHWEKIDTAVALAKKYGMTIKMHAALQNTPVWAWENWNGKSGYFANQGFLPAEKHTQAYYHFIRTLITRYGKDISCIELEGELNSTLGSNQYYKTTYPDSVVIDSAGQNWVASGKPFERAVELIGGAAKIIHELAPEVEIAVIRPSQGRPGEAWLFVRRFMERLEKRSTVFSADTYLITPFYIGPDIKVQRNPNVFDEREGTMQNIREMTRKPAFISESGLVLDHSVRDESPYQQYHSMVVVKDLMTCRAVGFFAYDWFTVISPFIDPIGYGHGLINAHQTSSAAAALSAVAQQVENAESGCYLKLNPYVRAAVLKKLDGSGTALVWSTAAGNMPVCSNWQISDMMGNPLTLPESGIALEDVPVWINTKSGETLVEELKQALIRMTDFCNIIFNRTGRDHATLLFQNISANSPLVLKVETNVPEKTFTVPMAPGSSNTLKIPLSPADHAIKGTVIDEWDNTRTSAFLFEVPEVTPVAKSPELLLSIGNLKDILQAEMMPPWTSDKDLSMKLYGHWDDQALHLSAEVSDDNHFHRPNLPGWQADAFHVAICPANDAVYAPKYSSGRHGEHDLEGCVFLDDTGKVHLDKYFGKYTPEPDEYTATRDETRKRTVYTLNLPWSKLGVIPHKDMVFGMSFVVPDDDTGNGREYDAFAGDGILNGKDAAKYRKFILQ